MLDNLESEEEWLERSHNSQAKLQIVLRDIKPDLFELILNYIYTDCIDPTPKSPDPMSDRIVLLMMDVYTLAVRFQMRRLEQMCINYLVVAINQKNVLVALQEATDLNLDFVKEFCMRFIVKDCNYTGIVMSCEFETLSSSMMVEIIRRKLTPPHPESNTEFSSFNMSMFSINTLEEEMRRFLQTDEEFTDINLIVDGETIRAHRAILAARCSYFEAMFRSFTPPPGGSVKVTIGDIIPSRSSFKTFLRYIYHGEVEMPPEDSLYLFTAPQFFGLSNNRLQTFCKENLETNVNTENVVGLLVVSDIIASEAMKKHALDLIVHHFKSISACGRLQDLSKDLLLDILRALAENLYDDRLGEEVTRSFCSVLMDRA